MITGVVAIGVSGAGGEGLTGEFFLVGVAAEMVFFFKQQPVVFVAEKIRGGEPRHASADDDHTCFFGGPGTIEHMAIADLMANFEMFAVHRWSWRRRIWGREKRGVDGATGGDGAGDYELDEITA